MIIYIQPVSDVGSSTIDWNRSTLQCSDDHNRDELFRNYPELEPEDLRQALAFAAANLEDTARETTVA